MAPAALAADPVRPAQAADPAVLLRAGAGAVYRLADVAADVVDGRAGRHGLVAAPQSWRTLVPRRAAAGRGGLHGRGAVARARGRRPRSGQARADRRGDPRRVPGGDLSKPARGGSTAPRARRVRAGRGAGRAVARRRAWAPRRCAAAAVVAGLRGGGRAAAARRGPQRRRRRPVLSPATVDAARTAQGAHARRSRQRALPGRDAGLPAPVRRGVASTGGDRCGPDQNGVDRSGVD